MRSPAAPRIVLALLAVLVAVPASAQLPFEPVTQFEFSLFGLAEVPPVGTDATGKCVGVLSEDLDTFSLSCLHDVAAPTAAHFHPGMPGETAPPVFGFDPDSPITVEWPVGTWEVVQVLAGGYYVNIHTAAKPNGLIRGQVLPQQPVDSRRIGFALRGGDASPPSPGSTVGYCAADVELHPVPFIPDDESTVRIICVHDAAGATDAGLYMGATGEEGALIEDLGSGASPVVATVELDVNQTKALLANETYVQVDEGTDSIRGQLPSCLEGPNTLCLNRGRFQVEIDWQTASDSGAGVADRETDDTGTFWFFRPTNLEMLIKVLDGCLVNGHYWVFFGPTTNVGFNLRVIDTQTGATKNYPNSQGSIGETRLDAAAFETCE
jgi:hypothetical protein